MHNNHCRQRASVTRETTAAVPHRLPPAISDRDDRQIGFARASAALDRARAALLSVAWPRGEDAGPRWLLEAARARARALSRARRQRLRRTRVPDARRSLSRIS